MVQTETLASSSHRHTVNIGVAARPLSYTTARNVTTFSTHLTTGMCHKRSEVTACYLRIAFLTIVRVHRTIRVHEKLGR